MAHSATGCLGTSFGNSADFFDIAFHSQPPGARSVEYGKNANPTRQDFVNNEIGKVLDDEFPRSFDLPDPAKSGLGLKRCNGFTYLANHTVCRCLIAFIQPSANRLQIFARGRSPENFYSRSRAENMALTSASLKSREARALATFSSSQASSRI